jgi:hypothetical protein
VYDTNVLQSGSEESTHGSDLMGQLEIAEDSHDEASYRNK